MKLKKFFVKGSVGMAVVYAVSEAEAKKKWRARFKKGVATATCVSPSLDLKSEEKRGSK